MQQAGQPGGDQRRQPAQDRELQQPHADGGHTHQRGGADRGGLAQAEALQHPRHVRGDAGRD
jgi:hypothetical protein